MVEATEKKTQNNKKWKVLIFFVLGISLVLLTGNIIVNRVIQNTVRERLAQLAPLAIVSYSSISASLLASSLTIKDLSIQFRRDSTDTIHQHQFNFRVAELSGVHFLKIFFNQNLSINALSLEEGEIKLDRFLLNKNDSLHVDFAKQMPFTSMNIGHLKIAESKLWLHSDGEDKLLLKGEIDIGDLKQDSSMAKNDFHFESVKCMITDLNYSIPNTFHTVRVKSLLADSKKELLEIDSLKIDTKYSKFELGKKLGRQADYIDATIPELKFEKLNVMQLLDKKLVADKISIDNIRLYVFRDRRLPRESKEQPMPNGYLKEMPFEVRVNQLRLNNASVISEEFPKEGKETGTLKIENINISMSPVLSRPHKNDPVYSDTHVEGSIMNAGALQASIRAPLRENIYEVKGMITNLDLPKLNPSSENLGRFHIESGVLNSLVFQFTATEEKATGTIVGEYHDLVIDRLKFEHGEKKVAKVPSFFLKHFIIPKNKDKSMDVKKRTGKIDYKRDPTRIVTFYFLKALLDGIRSSFDLGFLLPQ